MFTTSRTLASLLRWTPCGVHTMSCKCTSAAVSNASRDRRKYKEPGKGGCCVKHSIVMYSENWITKPIKDFRSSRHKKRQKVASQMFTASRTLAPLLRWTACGVRTQAHFCSSFKCVTRWQKNKKSLRKEGAV